MSTQFQNSMPQKGYRQGVGGIQSNLLQPGKEKLIEDEQLKQVFNWSRY